MTQTQRFGLPWRAVLAVVLLLSGTGMVGACRGESSATSTPPRSTPSPTESNAPAPGAEVNLGTGTALVWGSGNYGVVLVHGAIYDAASWTDQAEAISDAGFPVVAIEHATTDDTRAAIDYLRRTFGVTAVALVGASAGTGPVLSVARDASPGDESLIDLVIILAGSGDVSGLDLPSVLFISAEGDSGAASAAERMMNATSGNADDLLILPGSAHAQAIFNGPEGEAVLDAMIQRLYERQDLLDTEP